MASLNLTKKCKACFIEKSLDCFYKTKAWKCGYSSTCKICKPRYNEKTKVKHNENNKKYYEKLSIEKKREINKHKFQRISANLTVGFIKHQLKPVFARIGLSEEYISNDVISAYRETLKVKRFIKELNNENIK